MRVNLNTATTPGAFTNQVFDLIVQGTGITSPKVQEALRDHLVHGIGSKTAYESHGVLAPAFSVRLKRFWEEVARLREIISLCAPETSPAALEAALQEVDTLAQELKTKLGTALDMASGKV